MRADRIESRSLATHFCKTDHFFGSLKLYKRTLSAANILNESMTCSAVSTSVDSLVMKSRKQSNWTKPLPFGSTMDMMRWKSISPWKEKRAQMFRRSAGTGSGPSPKARAQITMSCCKSLIRLQVQRSEILAKSD